MKETIKQVEQLCDQIDWKEKEQQKKGLPHEQKKKLQNEKQVLIQKLHEIVDRLRDGFISEVGKKGLDSFPDTDLVECARILGRYLSYEIKITKIRRFLDGFRGIQLERELNPQAVALLRPKLAYAVGRSDKDEKQFMDRFLNFFDPILRDIAEHKDRNRFEKGLRFMESIIAYHRYYGGEN